MKKIQLNSICHLENGQVLRVTNIVKDRIVGIDSKHVKHGFTAADVTKVSNHLVVREIRKKRFALKDLAPGCIVFLKPYGASVCWTGIEAPQCGPCAMILRGTREDGTSALFGLADILKARV